MKNNDLKTQVKSARKSAANDIEESVLAALKKVASKLGQNSKSFIKKMEKGSKQLAKKLSKEIEFADQTIAVTGIINKSVSAAEKSQINAASEEKPAPVTNGAHVVNKATPKAKTASKPIAKDAKPV